MDKGEKDLQLELFIFEKADIAKDLKNLVILKLLLR